MWDPHLLRGMKGSPQRWVEQNGERTQNGEPFSGMDDDDMNGDDHRTWKGPYPNLRLLDADFEGYRVTSKCA